MRSNRKRTANAARGTGAERTASSCLALAESCETDEKGEIPQLIVVSLPVEKRPVKPGESEAFLDASWEALG